jgi:hypothetical protein
MTDEMLVEVGLHGLVWIEPVWKKHPASEGIRSAYAVIVNGEFIRDTRSVRPSLTFIPLGKFRIVSSGVANG